ncbi:hypothetical protein I553_8482 [Mycobacterium xenopi 4042]|uniref:Uncharacterized protein n=1 Tax=Mycobacterium xenopi 4042 TaxID=1299334 RepID=X8CK10_MYCXE|nr:hypothetical protein I553_8482 [Mycobacterium xenopi 4042]
MPGARRERRHHPKSYRFLEHACMARDAPTVKTVDLRGTKILVPKLFAFTDAWRPFAGIAAAAGHRHSNSEFEYPTTLSGPSACQHDR